MKVVLLVLIVCQVWSSLAQPQSGLRALGVGVYEKLSKLSKSELNALPEEVDLDALRRLVEGRLTAEDRARICRGFRHAVLSPLTCSDVEDDLSAAEAFVEQHGVLDASELAPVILIPGLGGSGLEAKIDKEDSPAWYCAKKNPFWYQIWLALYELAVQPCWFDNLQLTYDRNNNTYRDTPGVKIRPKDFGGLRGVDYLDHVDDIFKITGYYATIIKNLEKIGYKAGTTLYGAPFDWRLDAVTLFRDHWDDRFSDLVERAYNATGGKKVHIITHSMGGPTALYFLNRKSMAWKQQYIASFVPIAGPWSGSPKALRAMVSGDSFGLEFLGLSPVQKERMAKVARQSGGVAYLTPDEIFWEKGQVFVSTPSRNYTATQLSEMFVDLGTEVTSIVIKMTAEIVNALVHPEVPTYCLYGYNIATEIYYKYAEDFSTLDGKIPKQPLIFENDCGDGVVPLASLLECQHWVSEGAPDVNCREYPLREHSEVLKDATIMHDLIEIVTGKSSIHGCEPVWAEKCDQEAEVRLQTP